VARLRQAGAVVLGKTNVPRWSGDAQTYNELFGTTSNPWDTTRVPGGSSGGAAVAVAAGLTAFELGTDIAGSVRIPAHCCGTFGLKPSYGVIPQGGYLDSVGGGTTDADLNVFGPLARSAADLDLLLSVLAGPEPAPRPAWRLELPAGTAVALDGLRLGAWLDDPANPGERAMVTVLRDAAARLAAAGAHVDDVRPPVDPQAQWELFLVMVSGAMSVADEGGFGAALTHRDWLLHARRRAALRATWADWFAGYDAVLTPVMCTTAFGHQHDGGVVDRVLDINGETRPYVNVTWWTGMFGLLGLPAAVAPVGRTAAGLPVGLQVITSLYADRQAIRVAELIAEVAGGYDVPPGC
jgi:amidase